MRRLLHTPLLLLVALLCLMPLSVGAIDTAELADSLDAYTKERIVPMARVRVIRLRERGTRIDVETNVTMSGLSLTRDELQDLKRRISLWVRGDEKGQVYIYSDRHEMDELVSVLHPVSHEPDSIVTPSEREAEGFNREPLAGKRIALWPSHGAYMQKDSVWHWQRARLWGIVEDTYTYRYAEAVTAMLESAGAEVLWPRPRIGKDSLATAIGKSGLPRWMEGARYWLEEQHYPDWIWDTYRFQPRQEESDHYKDDLRCRGNWVNYLNDSVCKLDMALALHSDGLDLPGDSTLMGPLCLYTDFNDRKETVLRDGRSRITCRHLGDFIQTQVVEDMRRTLCPAWPRRELRQANYCETRVPDVPTVILEILSHKSRADMEYGLNPEAQFIISRAIYKGVVRYLTYCDSLNPDACVIQPLPVHRLNVQQADQDWLLGWEAQADPIEPTAMPDAYRVSVREDEGMWRDTVVREPFISLPARSGVQYDFRVTALNAGGESRTSEILSAYRANDSVSVPAVLIVNAFRQLRGPKWFIDSTYAGIVPGTYPVFDGVERAWLGEQRDFDKRSQWVDDDNCGYGMCYSDYLGRNVVGNTFDYPVMHGRELKALGISYVSCAADCHPDSICPERYPVVDYIAGRDTAMNTHWRKAFEHYAATGGHVLVTGSYIGDAKYTAARHASTSEHIRTMDGVTHRYSLRPNEERMAAEHATAFKPYRGGQIFARYTDSNLGAAICWDNRLILWGIPLESLEDFSTLYRQAILKLYEEKKSPAAN